MRMQSDGLFPANTHSDSARHWASAARMSLHEDGIVDWGPQVVRLVLVGLGLSGYYRRVMYKPWESGETSGLVR